MTFRKTALIYCIFLSMLSFQIQTLIGQENDQNLGTEKQQDDGKVGSAKSESNPITFKELNEFIRAELTSRIEDMTDEELAEENHRSRKKTEILMLVQSFVQVCAWADQDQAAINLIDFVKPIEASANVYMHLAAEHTKLQNFDRAEKYILKLKPAAREWCYNQLLPALAAYDSLEKGLDRIDKYNQNPKNRGDVQYVKAAVIYYFRGDTKTADEIMKKSQGHYNEIFESIKKSVIPDHEKHQIQNGFFRTQLTFQFFEPLKHKMMFRQCVIAYLQSESGDAKASMAAIKKAKAFEIENDKIRLMRDLLIVASLTNLGKNEKAKQLLKKHEAVMKKLITGAEPEPYRGFFFYVWLHHGEKSVESTRALIEVAENNKVSPEELWYFVDLFLYELIQRKNDRAARELIREYSDSGNFEFIDWYWIGLALAQESGKDRSKLKK